MFKFKLFTWDGQIKTGRVLAGTATAAKDILSALYDDFLQENSAFEIISLRKI